MTDGTQFAETIADGDRAGEAPAEEEPSTEMAADLEQPDSADEPDSVATEPEAVTEAVADQTPDAESAPEGDAPDATEEPAEQEPTEETESAVAEAGDVDDVSAAIAEADANFPPQPAQVTEEPAAESTSTLEMPVGGTVSWIPFIVYDLLWLAFAGVMVWQLSELPSTQVVFESQLYPLAVAGGLVLALVGPLLIIAVWLAALGKEDVSKGSLFVSALVRGSVATLLGVALWWGALVLLDQLRLGRLL